MRLVKLIAFNQSVQCQDDDNRGPNGMIRIFKPVKVLDETLKKEMKEAEDLLMSSLGIKFPNIAEIPNEEEMEQSLKILPKDFPYVTSGRVDEKAYKEKPIFSYYKGPVYWNDYEREVGIPSYALNLMQMACPVPMKPVRIHEGGDKPLTVQGLCEAVARVGFKHVFLERPVFLEQFDLTMRKINGEEAITIVFYCNLSLTATTRF